MGNKTVEKLGQKVTHNKLDKKARAFISASRLRLETL